MYSHNEIVFKEEQMKMLVAKDALLKLVYKDMICNRKHSSDDALKIIFNGYVLDDPIMEEEYRKFSK
ncbi:MULTISPECIES: hypothetical protein [Cytobacillus]|uniref:hypothetical protein n=2 Tax=Bacillaceae TaxID=186817 RepID=UPI00135AFFE8|nr:MULTISPECIES: hypothetical protein [Cytobacillus]KAF0817148.1 hypothetical protein KIS4809_4052 [Bacillus sp. ZZV12-4809]MCM3092112.1 hypothetical protein [Cytobacillus sp. AMY 15.2]MCM3708884.1 hypothetical protein [Cytobacillus firmus]